MKDYENSPNEQRELLDHLMQAAHALDDIIRGISSKTEEVEASELPTARKTGILTAGTRNGFCNAGVIFI